MKRNYNDITKILVQMKSLILVLMKHYSNKTTFE